MKAIQIAETGGPDVLRYVELEDPSPGPSEVLVDVTAAGINYIDTYHRTGLYPMSMPFVPGIEGSGVVSEVGDGVTEHAVGDRVMWAAGTGSYAQRRVVAADALVPVPESISLEVAACLPVQAMTAHYLATDTYAIKPGDRVLIHAGAGGVGLLLIQIAKMLGGEVFTTVSSAEKQSLATDAGADHVIRYDQDDFVEAIEAQAGPRPLAAIYDGVGAATFERGLGLIASRGVMVLFGQSSGPVAPLDLQVLAQNGSLFVTRPTLLDFVSERSELLKRGHDVVQWISRGDLKIRIGHRYPLSEAFQAHRDLEARRTTGKVLLVP